MGLFRGKNDQNLEKFDFSPMENGVFRGKNAKKTTFFLFHPIAGKKNRVKVYPISQ
jgi:hypothetical protein